MVVDVSPLCYLDNILCVCMFVSLHECARGYLSTITNTADAAVMVLCCASSWWPPSAPTRIITHNLLALFVSFVLLRVCSAACLCGVVTEMKNRIFGQSNRTPISDARKTICQSTTSRQSKHKVDHNDDDDDAVNASDAAVNEERLEVRSCVSLCIVCTVVTPAISCTCKCLYIWISSCESVNPSLDVV